MCSYCESAGVLDETGDMSAGRGHGMLIASCLIQPVCVLVFCQDH